MDTTTSKLPSSLTDANPSAFANNAHSAVDAAADAGKDVIARVATELHEGVDKVEPMVSTLEENARKAADLPIQWTDAAREAIREKPLMAMSGALLIGAALLHLLSSARRP